MKIEVRKTDSDKWGVFLGENLLGEAKWRFDADFAKVCLDKLLESEYNRGYNDAANDFGCCERPAKSATGVLVANQEEE